MKNSSKPKSLYDETKLETGFNGSLKLQCRETMERRTKHLGTFFFPGPLPFGGSPLEAYPWTSRESNDHRQSVRVAKNDALPTEPRGHLTKHLGAEDSERLASSTTSLEDEEVISLYSPRHWYGWHVNNRPKRQHDKHRHTWEVKQHRTMRKPELPAKSPEIT